MMTHAIGQRFAFGVGDAVICNGYPGTVTRVCDGQLTGMIEVRLPGGVCCVSASYPDCYPAEEVDITPTTPTRRNRGGSPKQYTDLVRINATMAAELIARFDAITPDGSFHERIRFLVDQQEQRTQEAQP